MSINLTVSDDDAVGLRVAEGGGSGGGAVWSVDGKTGDVSVLPTGGTQGQTLKKASDTDFDVEWADESGGGGAVTSVDGKTGAVTVLPSGGSNGAVLRKSSSSDYDVFWGSMVYSSATCTTDGSTAAKVASCSAYVATANSWLHVLIGNANTYTGAITLNVNSQGAKSIYINGAASSSTNYTLPAGTYLVYYDGTNYQFRTDGKLPGTTTGNYVKPSGGIPKTDLASAVQSALVPAGGSLFNVLTKGSADDYNTTWSAWIYSTPYSTTGGSTAAKTANCSRFALNANSWFPVLIGYSNSYAGAITLNINSTGAKSIYINGTASSTTNYTLPQGIYLVYYDGTNYYFRTDGKLTGIESETAVVNKTSSDTSQTLAENTFYIWPTMSSLTITCPATGGPFAFRFTSGSTATTLTMTGITMPDSFAVEASKTYEINVYEGYGVAVSWGVSS